MTTMLPKPTQLSGAKFLASRDYALLADLPRVGKTGSSIMAADYLMAETILIVTTASGRGVWKTGMQNWSAFDRGVQVMLGGKKLDPKTPCAIIGWAGLSQPKLRVELLKRKWDLIIPDEAHNAKSFTAKRTQALYGTLIDDGLTLNKTSAMTNTTGRMWCLTGTPLPNSPADAYPMLRALFRERLTTAFGPTDVTRQSDFIARYCKMRPMKIGHGYFARYIDVFVEGRNLEELNARVAGIFLQRTQADVGIMEPDYETMPLIAPKTLPAEIVDQKKAGAILEAAKSGDRAALEMHMGPLRRLTGEIKAGLVVDAVKEELDGALDKIVLAYWHKDVGALLLDGLSKYGVVGIDGATSADKRTENEERFRRDPKTRVFLAQIQAAGEAIDLSASANLIFVESSFTPAQMKQMALRICNHAQTKKPLVRVATLDGSIDDALQNILLRKWSAIREVLK
ncbi:SNF2-related protein [Nitratireductor soli]|uniref:SNF2-related protein n=1 Tax=Nitratireductor soli TaxID=1670619 RepID=UPI0009E6220E|nr:SNF2-related protein [Nitratireductor soli]